MRVLSERYRRCIHDLVFKTGKSNGYLKIEKDVGYVIRMDLSLAGQRSIRV